MLHMEDVKWFITCLGIPLTSDSHQVRHGQHHSYYLSIDCVGFVCRIFPPPHSFWVFWIVEGSTQFCQMECIIHKEVSSGRHALYRCIHAVPCTRGLQPWLKGINIYLSGDVLQTHSISPSSIKTVPVTTEGLVWSDSSSMSLNSLKRLLRSLGEDPFLTWA